MIKDILKYIFTGRKFYYFAAGVIVFGALFLLALDKAIMPFYTNHYEGITVPDVTRTTLEEAEATLKELGLRYEVAERRANAAFPTNYVIDQQPEASNIVKPRRKVYLTVNTEVKPQVEVPDVTSLSLRNAEIQLQNYGLEVGTISYESSRFKNAVLHQSIPEGTIVDKGITVDLIVSDGLGDQIVTVPEIIGLKLPQAQLKIREAGLRIGEITYKPTDAEEPNTILDFSPKVKEATEGETLNLIISERLKVEEEEEGGAVFGNDSETIPDSARSNPPGNVNK